jgi:multiple sugar transport system substrate-binding protein
MPPKVSFAMLAALCLLLAVIRGDLSCGSVARQRKIELSFWNGFTGPDGRTMLQIVRQFNEANPDVRVSMQRMDWATYYNKLMVAAMDGRGPEVFVVHASALPRMHRAGFVSDVRDLFDSGKIPAGDYEPYVLQQVRYGDAMAGVPLDIHPQGMYVNKAMLASIGLDHPPTNREEFLRAARELRRDTDRDGQPDDWGFALTMWRNNFQSLVPQFGGRFVDDKGNADLACPGNVRALEFMGTLAKEHLVPPPENGLGWVGYRQKRLAMVFEGVYMLGDLKRLNDLPYEGAPMPTIGDHPGTMADSHTLCIRRGISPERRKAAERFIAFLSEHSLEWADAGQVPARRSIRDTPEFRSMQVQSAFARQIPHVMYQPRITSLFEFLLEIDLAVEKVMRGRATPEEALRVANANAQRFIDRDRAERGDRP